MLWKTEIYEHIQGNDLHYCSSEIIKDVWTDTECYFDAKHDEHSETSLTQILSMLSF
jgi:hypothetical protein